MTAPLCYNHNTKDRGERCLKGSSSNLCSEISLLHLLCLSLHLVLSSVCLLHLGVWQRRWPSCRSTWPCSGRSMWRCSRSWPTQKGAVPCSLPRPPARVPPAPQLQTPSLAVCWILWPTSISRNSTGDEHGIQLHYYSFMCLHWCVIQPTHAASLLQWMGGWHNIIKASHVLSTVECSGHHIERLL